MYKINKEKLTKARKRRLKREDKGSDEKYHKSLVEYYKNLADEMDFNHQVIVDLNEEGVIDELFEDILLSIIKVEELRLDMLEEEPFKNQIEIIRSKQYIQAATLLINRQ